MTEMQEDQCGYTFPEDFHDEENTLSEPSKQTTCLRDSLPDTNRCAFHADPHTTEHKTERIHKELRENDWAPEGLDGAIIPPDATDLIDFDEISLLRGADLSGGCLADADLSGADLHHANLSEASLPLADLSGAYLEDADLSATNLHRADLSETYLKNADLSGADLSNADLLETNLNHANLSEANLEQSTLIGVKLFDTDLTKITPYGARVEATKTNNGTDFFTGAKEYARWWQREGTLLAAAPRCGYDPKVEQPDQATDTDREKLLTRAADTYRQFEELARRNTQPSLQRSMFVLRQDMQRRRYRERGQYIQWFANRVFRTVFKHGESFARILLTAGTIILLFGGVYWQAEMIVTNPDVPTARQEFIRNPIDAIYFSTLIFTTLGLGDFQPAPTSQLGRGLVLFEAVLGAILIATFVFVLGRRAAR